MTNILDGSSKFVDTLYTRQQVKKSIAHVCSDAAHALEDVHFDL